MPDTDLVRLLTSIGKSTFVRYYEEFNNPNISNQEMVEMLPAEYTLKSRNSRTSKARRIFREGLEEDALTLIMDSSHVDADTANRARELLNKQPTIKRPASAEAKAKLAELEREVKRLQDEIADEKRRRGMAS